MLINRIGLTVVAATSSHDLNNSLKFNADLQQHAKHWAGVLLTIHQIHKGKFHQAQKGKFHQVHKGKLLC